MGEKTTLEPVQRGPRQCQRLDTGENPTTLEPVQEGTRQYQTVRGEGVMSETAHGRCGTLSDSFTTKLHPSRVGVWEHTDVLKRMQAVFVNLDVSLKNMLT